MLAVLWMLGTLSSFSLMAIGARELSGGLSVVQILFFRSIVGVGIMATILYLTHTSLFTKRIRLHVFRNSTHFCGQYCWFLGISLLPLAEVFALEFTVPIWVLLIAAIFLGEKITLRKIIALILGLIGVLVIVKPGYDIVDSASFIVLAAALFFAITNTVTKSLSRSEPISLILFYMCLVQAILAFLLALSHWAWPQGIQWFWICLIAVAALSAFACMVKAMNYAEVSTLSMIDFFRLPLIALVGVLVYKEAFDFSLILGGLLMLAGNLISLKSLKKVNQPS